MQQIKKLQFSNKETIQKLPDPLQIQVLKIKAKIS